MAAQKSSHPLGAQSFRATRIDQKALGVLTEPRVWRREAQPVLDHDPLGQAVFLVPGQLLAALILFLSRENTLDSAAAIGPFSIVCFRRRFKGLTFTIVFYGVNRAEFSGNSHIGRMGGRYRI